MKKMFFIAVSAIMMATATAKGEENLAPAANYKLVMNMRALSRYLVLNDEQADGMALVADDFRREVARLEKTAAEKRPERMQKALRKNLSYAHAILTPEQYRRYLVILNSTMVNNGLSDLLVSNDIAMND